MKFRILVVAGALTLGGCSGGFTDEDIKNTKNSIKSEFEKRSGVVVKDVTMLKESDRKLAGYVTISIRGAGDVTKSCNATMDERGGQYIWRCD